MEDDLTLSFQQVRRTFSSICPEDPDQGPPFCQRTYHVLNDMEITLDQLHTVALHIKRLGANVDEDSNWPIYLLLLIVVYVLAKDFKALAHLFVIVSTLILTAKCKITMSYQDWYDKIEAAMKEGKSGKPLLLEYERQLYDHIKSKETKDRYPFFLLCRLELIRNDASDIKNLLTLTRLRCKDSYVEYIFNFFVKNIDNVHTKETQRKLIRFFENPENNIQLNKLTNEATEATVNGGGQSYENILTEAYLAFESENFAKSLDLLNEAAEIAKKSKKEVDNKVALSLKFLTALAQTKVGTQTSLANALETFKALIGTRILKDESDVMKAGQAERIPMALLGLGLWMEKSFRYKVGMKVVERGLHIVNKKFDNLPSFQYPGTEKEINLCKAEILKEELLQLQQRLRVPPKPEAFCRYEGCLDMDHQEIPIREIYVEDPDFIGYTVITCENGCQIAYHPHCWKAYKDSVGTTPKMSDKEMLGRKCPTADCTGEDRQPSRICQLVPYDKDGKSKTTLEIKEHDAPAQVVAAVPSQNKRKPRKRVTSGSESHPGTGNKAASAQPNKAAEEKRSQAAPAVKNSPMKVNRGNAHLVKTASVEQDENVLATAIVQEKIPQARKSAGQIQTLLEATCTEPKDKSPLSKQLWFLFVSDMLKNSGGAMEKSALFEAFSQAFDILNDFKQNVLGVERLKGLVSQTEFFKNLLLTGEFGCVDDQICFVQQMTETNDWNVKDYENLYGRLFKVKFLPGPIRKSRPALLPIMQDPTQILTDCEAKVEKVKEEVVEKKAPAVEIEKPMEEAASYLSEEFKNFDDAPVFDPNKGVKEVEKPPLVEADEVVSAENVLNPETVSDAAEHAKLQLKKANERLEKRVAVLELELSTEADKLKSQVKTTDRLGEELHKLTISHEKLKTEANDTERMLNEHLAKARKEKDSMAKQLQDLQKQKKDLEKELADKKKQTDGLDVAKAKKKKQTDICSLAIQRVIQQIEGHWNHIKSSYESSKMENEELIMSLLDILNETSKPTYQEAMESLQAWETLMVGVEASGSALKTRLDTVRDVSKGPEMNWPILSQIHVPKVDDMPKCVITKAAREILKEHHANREAASVPEPEVVVVEEEAAAVPEQPDDQSGEEAAGFDLPSSFQFQLHIDQQPQLPLQTPFHNNFYEPPPSSRPLLPPSLFAKAMNPSNAQTSPLPPCLISSTPSSARDCPSPTSSISSTSSVNCSENSFSSGLSLLRPQEQVVIPRSTRDLLPTSLRQHVTRLQTKANSMADTLKKPEAPKIQPVPATKVPISQLKIPLAFAEQQNKLIELKRLIPYTSDNDFKQALHWLCQRNDDVASLTKEALQKEVCDILTELLMAAPIEELSGVTQDRCLMLERPNDDDKCPICICTFRDDPDPVHILTCGHLFHKKCIRNWFDVKSRDNQSCPNCRKDVNLNAPNTDFPPLGQNSRR